MRLSEASSWERLEYSERPPCQGAAAGSRNERVRYDARFRTHRRWDVASLQKVANQWIGFFNKKDLQQLMTLYAANCRNTQPHLPQPLKGRAAVEKEFGAFFRAFPDGKIKVLAIVVKGDTIAMEWAFNGTQQGPITGPTGTIPATGKKAAIKGAEFMRLNAKGQIVDERGYFDLVGIMAQLGVGARPAGSEQRPG
jgi:steroid delta-isomerase-like uncharacterized protein